MAKSVAWIRPWGDEYAVSYANMLDALGRWLARHWWLHWSWVMAHAPTLKP